MFSVLVFNYVYGIFAWTQYEVFHHVMIPSITIKVVASVMAVVWMVFMGRARFRGVLLVGGKILWAYSAWMAYSLVNLVFLARFSYSLLYMIFTFVVMLLYPSMFFFLTIAPENSTRELTSDSANP